MATYFGAQRQENDIVMYMSAKQTPEVPPFELQAHIPQDVWNTRIPAIVRVATRYSKPMLERIWVVIGFLAVFIAPAVVYPLLTHSIVNDRNTTPFLSKKDSDRYFQARGIATAVFVGIFAFFWIPLLIWKAIGIKRVNALATGWEKEDRAMRGPGAAVPIWKVRCPGVINASIMVTISIPFDAAPSTFHPNAYLPSYLNGPVDADAQAYNSYNQPGYGVDAAGNVPLYHEKMRTMHVVNPFSDPPATTKEKEKNPFEDVKV